MPILLDVRKKPIEVKVHVREGSGVDITWSDGHASHYEFAYLREWCPCALCNDERGKKTQVASLTGLGAAEVLPMFKPKPTARKATTVGSYAIQIEFSDGHSTGIYSFDHLREICPCAVCAKEFRAQSKENPG
jgi:DUF971 family protein